MNTGNEIVATASLVCGLSAIEAADSNLSVPCFLKTELCKQKYVFNGRANWKIRTDFKDTRHGFPNRNALVSVLGGCADIVRDWRPD